MKIETVDTFPQKLHYAILEFDIKNIYHEGDERSQRVPGHGYLAYTESVRIINYIYFLDIDKVKEWIIDAEKKGKKYQLIKAEPIKTSIKADVTFS